MPGAMIIAVGLLGTPIAQKHVPATIVDRVVPALAANANLAALPAQKVPDQLIGSDPDPALMVEASHVDASQEAHHEEPILSPTSDSSVAPTDPPPQAEEQAPPVTVASLTPTEEIIGPNPAPDDCGVTSACVDHYLWTLYEHTPKEDTVRTATQRKISIKKGGKTISVTRTSTTLTDEDFAWKDAKAADKAGMSLEDYVVGGVDPDFKLRLFRMLQAAESAGLAPGITSAFRDDYRQSIASGLKAADDRSYHGGSFHGGYHHGLAADVVSTRGETRDERLASTQVLWKWIDTHGPEYGIGRPYLGRDPPHLAPIDGEEYAKHRLGMKARQRTPGSVTPPVTSERDAHHPS